MSLTTSYRSLRRVFVSIAAAGIILTFGTSSIGASATNTPPPIKIGVEGPLTGPQSATGIDMWNGVSLLVNRVNASGGVLGHKIDLIKIDDKANATTAVAVAKSAIKQHVVAIIGPYNSSVGIANLATYRNAGVITIRLTSNHATDGYGITVQPMDYQVASIESEAILKSLPSKSRVAIVYEKSAYTSGIALQVKNLLKTGGLDVSAFASINSTQSNFTSVLAKIKTSQPALTYYVAYDPQAEDLVKQANALDVPGTCFVDGLAAEGPTFVQATGIALAQKCVFSGVPSASQLSDASSYITTYEAAFHQSPGTWGAFAYDSAAVLFHAVNTVKTWNAKTVNNQLKKTIGFQGITGTISIDPKTGNRINPPIVLLTVSPQGNFEISSTWKASGKLPLLSVTSN